MAVDQWIGKVFAGRPLRALDRDTMRAIGKEKDRGARFEVADRIHVHHLGKRIAVLNPKAVDMSDTVAIMTGAVDPPGAG